MGTIDLAALRQELSCFEKNIAPIAVGNYSGFRYSTRTPAHLVETVDLVIPSLGFLHIVARDSFDRSFLDLLIAAFDRVKKNRYEDTLRVYSTHDLGAFDCIGIAPPLVAKIYEAQSPRLAQSGFQLFPMHGIEFLNGFTAKEFWTQRERRDKWNVCILDWRRRIEISRRSPQVD